jgi:hypothetical protein
VEVIIEEFSLPEEIAAVTLIGLCSFHFLHDFVDRDLIAFGSSTPEILLNTISAVKEASSLSMPALLGSGCPSIVSCFLTSLQLLLPLG